jgi:hypothetical protein
MIARAWSTQTRYIRSSNRNTCTDISTAYPIWIFSPMNYRTASLLCVCKSCSGRLEQLFLINKGTETYLSLTFKVNGILPHQTWNKYSQDHRGGQCRRIASRSNRSCSGSNVHLSDVALMLSALTVQYTRRPEGGLRVQMILKQRKAPPFWLSLVLLTLLWTFSEGYRISRLLPLKGKPHGTVQTPLNEHDRRTAR